MNGSARALDRIRDALDVTKRMKARLPREDDARSGVEGVERRPIEARDAGESRASRRFELVVEHRGDLFWPEKQIAVDALEGAGDRFARDDRLDVVDRAGVTFVRDPSAARSVHAFELEKSVVERAREVRRGLRGLAPADVTRVEND